MPLDRQPAEPAALIVGVLATDAGTVEAAARELEQTFGPLRDCSAAYDFAAYTRYYEDEMGPGLVKQILWFREVVAPEQLAAAKEHTMAVERQLARFEGDVWRRRANLDPGLVSPDGLVLATTKPSGHRVCIAPGLYAEVTLLFERGAYRPLPWSYRDFRSPEVQAFLIEIRQDLLDRRPRGADRG